jgi:hypothetical protein
MSSHPAIWSKLVLGVWRDIDYPDCVSPQPLQENTGLVPHVRPRPLDNVVKYTINKYIHGVTLKEMVIFVFRTVFENLKSVFTRLKLSNALLQQALLKASRL